MTSLFWGAYTVFTRGAIPPNVCHGRPEIQSKTQEFCAMVAKAKEQLPDSPPPRCTYATYSTISVDPKTGVITPLHKDRVIPTWLLKIRLFAAEYFAPNTFFDSVGLWNVKENVFYVMPGPISADTLLKHLQPKDTGR